MQRAKDMQITERCTIFSLTIKAQERLKKLHLDLRYSLRKMDILIPTIALNWTFPFYLLDSLLTCCLTYFLWKGYITQERMAIPCKRKTTNKLPKKPLPDGVHAHLVSKSLQSLVSSLINSLITNSYPLISLALWDKANFTFPLNL